MNFVLFSQWGETGHFHFLHEDGRPVKPGAVMGCSEGVSPGSSLFFAEGQNRNPADIPLDPVSSQCSAFNFTQTWVMPALLQTDIKSSHCQLVHLLYQAEGGGGGDLLWTIVKSFNIWSGTRCLQNRCQLIIFVWGLCCNPIVCTNFQIRSGMIIYQNRKQKLAHDCFRVCDDEIHMWFISSEFIGIPHCLDCASSPEGRVSKVFVDIVTQASTKQLVVDGSVLFWMQIQAFCGCQSTDE